jgi:hypothetical protein
MNDAFSDKAHEATAKLAYQLWDRRGRPFGSPEEDWFAAEEFLAQRDPHLGLPLNGMTLEANEGPCIPPDMQTKGASS